MKLRAVDAMIRCALLALFPAMAGTATGAIAKHEVASVFASGNRLYEQGKMADAIQAYEHVLTNGVQSASLHFNMGNAVLQDGRPGSAVAHWHQARRLTPRDPDIQANLDFVRRSGAVSGPVGERPWERALHQLNLNEWAGIALCGVWLWTGLLFAGRHSPAWKQALSGYRLGAGIFTLTGGTALILAAWTELGRPLGVVVVREATARYSPLADSTAAFRLAEGSEVRVLDHHGEWCLITASGHPRSAWLPNDSLTVIQ